MKKTFIVSCLSAVFALVGCQQKHDCQVYYNAKVYTSDTQMPGASAFVVEEGKITFVGNDKDALDFAGRSAEKIDLQGKRIIPGMCDTHCHCFAMSMALSQKPIVILSEDDSHEQTLRKIKEFADQHPQETIINGFGWGWNVKVFASELDKLGIDKPIFLSSCDGHSAWVNTKLLELLHVDKNFKDIAPGASCFQRDAAGNPTGRVIEVAQCYWAMQKLNLKDESDIVAGLPVVTHFYNSCGLTTVYDAGALSVPDEVALKGISMLPDNTLRVFSSFYYNGTETDDEFIARAKMLREKYTTDMVRPNTFKAFKDGTIEVATAYMYEPYKQPFGSGNGISLFTTEHLTRIASKMAAEGFNIHIHAIGDRAVNETLDVMHNLGKIKGTKAIAHCQYLNEEALAKFAANKDVFYQTTPVWVYDDRNMASVFGEERYLKYNLPLKTVLDGGSTLSFGSDGPASRGEYGINPINNIWACTNQGNDPTLVNRPSENITVAQAVDGYTINAARQMGAADEFGSITVGKSADFVVLSQDIFSIDPANIKDTKVEKTFLKGKCVYSL